MESLRQTYHKSCPFRDFNTTMKHVLRHMYKVLPTMSKQLDIVMSAYKIIKTINKRWPHSQFYDMIAKPGAEYIKTHDDSFFLSDMFTIPGYGELIDEFRAVWKTMSAEEQRHVWGLVDVLMEKHLVCQTYKSTPKFDAAL